MKLTYNACIQATLQDEVNQLNTGLHDSDNLKKTKLLQKQQSNSAKNAFQLDQTSTWQIHWELEMIWKDIPDKNQLEVWGLPQMMISGINILEA